MRLHGSLGLHLADIEHRLWVVAAVYCHPRRELHVPRTIRPRLLGRTIDSCQVTLYSMTKLASQLLFAL